MEDCMNRVPEILKGIRPEYDFSTSEDFVKDGLLDSLDIVNLVVALEEEYGISIDGEDVTPENFKNLETLEQFLQRHVSL
jgi:acyl carrier protein